ncbi:nucleotidyltransferase domain-containing protein [Candidatus Woesearchaeota archaeon]|nr:nucleotidyltransferase domain-containing protein [Candidatus Woesearchaeota archaeon]MBW3022121.1 nucleotidyltransferase domain-containing protein [Candidatus Woesearchaeota archaeon]
MKQNHQIALEKIIQEQKKDPNVLGIMIGGSFVKDQMRANSDIDVWILVKGKERWKEYRVFEGVEFELFYNPYEQYLAYMDSHPSMVQICDEGIVVYDPQGKMQEIKDIGKQRYHEGPNAKEDYNWQWNYLIIDPLKDVEDALGKEDEQLAMNFALDCIVKIFLKARNLWQQKPKYLLGYLDKHDKGFADLLRDYLAQKQPQAQYQALKALGNHVLKDFEEMPENWHGGRQIAPVFRNKD